MQPPVLEPPRDAMERVLYYHERTKHHPNRYAASPGFLDWANQPNPFRRYSGASLTPLSLSASSVTTGYHALHIAEFVTPYPLSADSLGAFFEMALGLTAWKRAGESTWALRSNPSSGNLHPTEGYLACRGLEGIPDGVHHYAPREHALEHRCSAVLSLPGGCFVVGLSSIHWREAWKYGERAWRYCQHDAGHAIATVRYAASALGWTARLLDMPADADVAALLGLDREVDFEGVEREHPDTLLLVGSGSLPELDLDALVGSARCGRWSGQANRLSAEHVDWEIIDAAAEAATKPRSVCPAWTLSPGPALELPEDDIQAAGLFRRRRSAQAFDGRTGLRVEAFFRMIERLAPRPGIPPWDVLPWEPLVHPFFLVHRVAGLIPGIYAAPRTLEATAHLRAATDPSFTWESVYEGGLTLFRLREGDAREAGRIVSCLQDIASDGAFTLGMVAEYETIIRQRGPWWYRRLFWEAGVMGQVLYLEAEAMGLRGTGIGCFFDDLFHGLLGIKDAAFQSLYHFTVGMPLEDTRLQTLPPYAHLTDRTEEIE